MDKKQLEDIERAFLGKLEKPPYPVDEMLSLCDEVPLSKAEEWVLLLLQALIEAGDFPGMLKLVLARTALLEEKVGAASIADSFKKVCEDRLVLSFIDVAGLGSGPLGKSMERLEKLLSFTPGRIVVNKVTWDWGAGEVRRLDYFYRKMTVNFTRKPNHQMTFQAALDTLAVAPEGHILAVARTDPDRVRAMLKDHPGQFLEEVLKTYGPQPVNRLEDFCTANGFVKPANWKSFWDSARRELSQDKRVAIPARRADPIVLKAAAEDYGGSWFNALASDKDPRNILKSVRDFRLHKTKDVASLPDREKAIVGERLAFALKGAKLVDDALYAAIAALIDECGFAEPSAAVMRGYLEEDGRYIAAAAEMPARDVGLLVRFMLKGGESFKSRLLSDMPDMGFTLLSETIEAFNGTPGAEGEAAKPDPDCEERVAGLLREPKPPAPLVAYVLGRRSSFANWNLPPLVLVLGHAIALGEGRQNGETLRMQNIVRRLFADKKWLFEMLEALSPEDRVLFYERFEASIAWDPASHHTIAVRMTQCPAAPELAGRAARTRQAAAPAPERITSARSYAMRKAEYKRLVEVEMPKNAKDIEVARSYGDLRENFEYQAAKDEQRALLQKHDLLQKALEEVKPVDFTGVKGDKVEPGTTVVLAMADGSRRTWTILGEWDNDESLGIISSKAKLAENMAGKAPGDKVEVLEADGSSAEALIESVSPLSAEMLEYVKAPAAEAS